jgi:DNA polymerase elongation subunit (family B)
MPQEQIKQTVDSATIEQFLEGQDPQKYIVAIEAPYDDNKVSLIINDPVKGKSIERHKYKPFIWLKEEVAGRLYGGNKAARRKAMAKNNITIRRLKTTDANGNEPDRMTRGFKYIATCNGSPNQLINFFKYGGVEIYGGKGGPRNFMSLRPEEQFLMQTGKRLFKGMDDYDDIHRFQFDLETMGLDPRRHPIFQIGMKDNRGYERIIEIKGDTEQERRDSEREAIKTFFEVIDGLKPDTITGYNSENFDWDYFYKRCEVLYLNIESLSKTLNTKVNIKRKSSTLKLGQETEYFEQTLMWGYNILDIIHAVKKAQAINSNIKKAGLKYITQFSKVAKKNRVYVEGDKLHTTWASEGTFYLNDTNGDWFEYNEAEPNKEHLEKISGKDTPYKRVDGDYIVQRYLLDDLWETEQVDAIYNQASFLVAKILPTSFMRSSTMGTAGTWTLIMSAWSLENKLAIPDFEPKRKFTGGLARLLEVGFAGRVIKLDYAALYPKTQLTHNIFPKLDISGVMEGLLTYIVDTRDEFKFKTGDEKKLAKKLVEELAEKKDKLTSEEIKACEAQIKKHQRQSSDYDKKQLPLKILANSFFGSFGAPYLFPWGDMDSAEEITCRGRQYLRLMVKHFTETHGFRPLVGDTDGFNFAIPDHVDDVTYTCTAGHWKTSKLAEFNEVYMEGRMGLDIDDICESTINFKRKNYANLIDGKVKLVGNSIKSKAMPIYIEEFIDKGIRMLLDGKGKEFVEYYYQYVDDIYNCRIPLVKIATKKRVKMSIDEYQNTYIKTKTKNGIMKARQAHMELAVKHNLHVDNGDTIYYVNTGNVKSTGDTKKVTDKETKRVTIELNCKLIPADQIEKNPELTTDEYNVPRYLANFNKRIHSLLVCFSPEIRDSILIDVEKIKIKGVKAKDLEWSLEERSQFTSKQCSMNAGTPIEEHHQDSYEDLMIMEDKEIRFWSSVNMLPNQMEEEEWLPLEADWKERMRQARIDGIKNDKIKLDEIFKRLEMKELEDIATSNELPKQILAIAHPTEHSEYGYSLHSEEWDTWLCKLEDMFKYKELAATRDEYYKVNPDLFKKLKRGQTKYDIWENLMEIEKEEKEDKGLSSGERFNPTCTEKYCCSEEWNGKCPCSEQFDGDKDKLNAYIESQKNIGTCPTCIDEQKACGCDNKKELVPLPKVKKQEQLEMDFEVPDSELNELERELGTIKQVDVGEPNPIIIEEGTDVMYTETHDEMLKRVEEEEEEEEEDFWNF